MPLFAITVVSFVFFLLGDNFSKILPSSCKKYFLHHLFFSSTKKVKPLKLSLKICFFIVGKKELYLSVLNSSLDLFNAKGVKKTEKN